MNTPIELQRIPSDEFYLVIHKGWSEIIVSLEGKGSKRGVRLASAPTELEALVAARVALLKIYKACPDPVRSIVKEAP